ncbi:unnamed protein product [Cuscuta campestris]|uniref:Uncharacterized protein n=1 Tax=Cuscuta campestris TaxID=132261 RepID=A0A484N218_9ASTE|nr:unnamed protein product [Cuscuta campestris]
MYIHPKLKSTGKIFGALEDLDVKEGAKTKFYLNLLNLCESCGEKLLVFSQYVPPAIEVLGEVDREDQRVQSWEGDVRDHHGGLRVHGPGLGRGRVQLVPARLGFLRVDPGVRGGDFARRGVTGRGAGRAPQPVGHPTGGGPGVPARPD